jgi:glycosyltransferase involved in cell wall biosynthesis
MRIGIDVRYLSHGLVGGVHTYLANLLPELVRSAAEHEVFLYADTKRPFETRDLPANVSVRLLPWCNPLSSIAHDLFMRNQMARDRLDVAHFPANYGFGPPGARAVITLHDVINLLPLREIVRGHPKKPQTIAMMTYLHLCTRLAIPRADLLLTVSEFARQEIATRGGIDAGRIVAVHHAPTPDLRRIDDPMTLADVRQRHEINHPFVLADALKNPSTLVRAWRRLPAPVRDDRRIVFFSRRPDPLPIVHEAVAAGEARLLVRPSRPDLIALFSMADAFVFPSWIEGFGIPLLEAMTCGAPVIASDRGSIPEVVDGAGLIADAEDDATFADHLRRVLTSPTETERLRARGFARAAQFSWRKTARRTLDSYRLPAGAHA